MKQYEVAEKIKEKIDLSFSKEEVKLKVQFSQREDRDKLAINLELVGFQIIQFELLIKHLFGKLKEQIYE